MRISKGTCTGHGLVKALARGEGIELGLQCLGASLAAAAVRRGEEFSGLVCLPMKDATLALDSLLFCGALVSIYL